MINSLLILRCNYKMNWIRFKEYLTDKIDNLKYIHSVKDMKMIENMNTFSKIYISIFLLKSDLHIVKIKYILLVQF